jgi:hypothetical protein
MDSFGRFLNDARSGATNAPAPKVRRAPAVADVTARLKVL